MRKRYARQPKAITPTPEQRKAEYWGRLYAEIAAFEHARRLEEGRDPERLEFWRQPMCRCRRSRWWMSTTAASGESRTVSYRQRFRDRTPARASWGNVFTQM